MTRTILSGLAVAAALSGSAVPPAAAQSLADDMLISSFQTGGTASRNTRKRVKQPKALSSQQRKQRFYYNKISPTYVPTKDGKR